MSCPNVVAVIFHFER